jgi:cell division protein FtsQ
VSNRRSKKATSSRVRAPQDSASYEEGDAPRVKKGRWSHAVLALKIVLGLSALSAAAGGLAFGVHRYAQTTPRFSATNIEIEGTRRLMRQDVLATAGIHEGDNLFSLDIEKAEKALIESPWVSSARVTRRLPGTVRVHLVERDPRAIGVIGGRNFLVSSDGVPFKELGRGDPHDLPVITGIGVQALARDRRAETARIVETLGLFQAYEKLPVAKKYPVQEAHLNSTGDVTLVVGEAGTTLHLGSGPFKRKLLRAERVLEKTLRLGGEPEVAFLDNEAHPERVVVRVK